MAELRSSIIFGPCTRVFQNIQPNPGSRADGTPCTHNLPERVVEPPVEEGVVAVGAHGQHVAQEEDEVVVVPATECRKITR